MGRARTSVWVLWVNPATQRRGANKGVQRGVRGERSRLRQHDLILERFRFKPPLVDSLTPVRSLGKRYTLKVQLFEYKYLQWDGITRVEDIVVPAQGGIPSPVPFWQRGGVPRATSHFQGWSRPSLYFLFCPGADHRSREVRSPIASAHTRATPPISDVR